MNEEWRGAIFEEERLREAGERAKDGKKSRKPCGEGL